MYSLRNKKRVNLWLKCKSRAKKRSGPASDASQSKRQSSHLSMMNEVDAIVIKLKEIHGDKFTPTQLNY